MQQDRVGVKIRILANLIVRHLNEQGFSGACRGLTGPQALVLGYLFDHQNEDIFQKDVEVTFGIRRSSATGLLKSLEKNGFIKRVSVAHDARLKKIILTKKADEFKEASRTRIYQLEETLVKGLDPEEIETLLSIMDKIKVNLE